MTDVSFKPLNILTLDGGGLQAVSTLLILRNVLDTIALENGLKERPRPCDVFETIAGIGAGGWLAILLGRFQMDIFACLTEWSNFMQRIAPRSKLDQLRLRLFKDCYFDRERLIEQVDSLTKRYGTGDYLFEPNIDDNARTRHVFVAAITPDDNNKNYSLFRSYELPHSAKLPGKLLRGPQDPSKLKISSAFGVTGAARYFSMPWQEHMKGGYGGGGCGGKITFHDTRFPKPHNITALALEEMWGIYGDAVPLSLVLNIGPGLPHISDVKQITQRFSWGLKANPTHEMSSTPAPSDKAQQGEQKPSSVVRPNNTIGSIKNRGSGVDVQLRKLEEDMEKDIREKLESVRPGTSELYVRLALAEAPQDARQNDFLLSGAALNAVTDYASQDPVVATIRKVAERVREVGFDC